MQLENRPLQSKVKTVGFLGGRMVEEKKTLGKGGYFL